MTTGSELAAPPVTLDHGRQPAVPSRPGGPRTGGLPAALCLLGLAAALALAAAPPPPVPLRVFVQLVEDRVVSSAGGVLVLPVAVDGPVGLSLDGVSVRAAPVGQPPVTSGGRRVDEHGRTRVVVVVQPDCRALAAAGGFTATVTVRAEDEHDQTADLVLDLARHPVVAERVRRVCTRAS
jgi:hypothetical protein